MGRDQPTSVSQPLLIHTLSNVLVFSFAMLEYGSQSPIGSALFLPHFALMDLLSTH